MQGEFFWLITLMDLTAAIIIFAGALSERMRLYPTWHKVGLIVAVIGLVCQAARNVTFIFTGKSPSDSDMPLWVFKDAGIAIIAYFYFYLAIKAKFFTKPVTKAKRGVKK